MGREPGWNLQVQFVGGKSASTVRLYGGNLWEVGGKGVGRESVEGNQRMRSLWVGLGKYCGGEGRGMEFVGDSGWLSCMGGQSICEGIEYARIFGFISRRGKCSMG
jgi:hypothetical protein